VFVGSGVRCKYHKRDQLGHEPCTCLFVTPCKSAKDLPLAEENMLIAKVFRDITKIALGTKNPECKGEFFYYFKFCHHCQKPSTKICDKCELPACEDCWKKYHEGHPGKTVVDYEKNVVQCHKCSKCGSRAFKYCAICKLFLCRNRKKCFDPCMDPDHLLIEYDPSLVEIKRFESTAVDNSRKMFIHDVHDYLETDPFFWQAADMESLGRTVWFQEFYRCHPDEMKRAKGGDDDASEKKKAEDGDEDPSEKKKAEDGDEDPSEKKKAEDGDEDPSDKKKAEDGDEDPSDKK